MKRLAWGLSFAVGLLSLSQEILWVRLVGFSQQARPHAFPLVLTAFLVGISIGAVVGRRLCRDNPDLLRSAARLLGAAAAVDLAVLWMAPNILQYLPPPLMVTVLAIALTAGLKGAMFPIVHHLGADADASRVGRSVSTVYLANVAGATLGPVITGFWLLDHVDTERAWALVAAGTAALAGLLWWRAGVGQGAGKGGHTRARRDLPAALALGVLAAWAVARPPAVVSELVSGFVKVDRVRHVIQNKHGIVHVVAEESPGRGDITFGGNVYDGRISVDLQVNSNTLERVYLMAAVHPQPRRALVIGLSTGAWTRAIAGLPGLESVDVVEINPGYLELMRLYPQVAPLLEDPKVRIHIDDGRRWMRARSDERFDLIFQNTTYHWRANATRLLSREYFELNKAHLAPGGILAVNSTGSRDVLVTAQAVFTHVRDYRGFVYMSDAPLVLQPRALETLRAARIGERPAFAATQFEGEGLGALILRLPFQEPAQLLARGSLAEPPRVIHDLNLIPEFRHGRSPLFGALKALLPPSPHPF